MFIALSLYVYCNPQYPETCGQDMDVPDAEAYLESQKKWSLFNTKSSFFRGDSPFFLHFQ